MKSSWTALIDRFRDSFHDLGVSLPGAQIEALAVNVHTAMSGTLRRFHSLEHLFRFEPRDGVEGLAVLYHDVVYWSVDGSWPLGFAEVLGGVADSAIPGAVLAADAAIPFYGEVLAVFGLSPRAVLGKAGANELFSALAFAFSLGAELGRETTLAVAACIEATIPFRGPASRAALKDRLRSLDVEADEADAWVMRAVHMANQDVGDFKLEDTGSFLGGTWNLLPELNPELRITAVFTIQAYRKALEATDRFFSFLTPDLLFDGWGDEPGDEELRRWKAQAAANLTVARDYLWAKLFASALLEAFALATGPDVPLSLFMGAASDSSSIRLEALLPSLGPGPESDPVFALLEKGRSTQSSFDLTNSPVAAWIYRQMTPSERDLQRERTKQFFAGGMPAEAYLAGWSRSVAGGLGGALAAFVPTRSASLATLGFSPGARLSGR